MTIETDFCKNFAEQDANVPNRLSNGICSDGTLRPHWQQLMEDLKQLGPKRLEKRRKEALRLLREHGATYDFFDSLEDQRSWQFDPVPLIFSQEDWAPLETGLIQRARLLDLILRDIYGEQRLLQQGLLPPELVFAHKGFLYPSSDLLPADKNRLHLYSANLSRTPQGNYRVVEDRTNPAFGVGFALETRIVMNRSFPRLLANFQVHRLAMYFRSLRSSLAALAPPDRSDPRIVVLTPGPDSDAYFEHAYFASYLGYPLVQGGDLIVRDGYVWLKSVGGLRQVDVILRRVADELCDPLELRGDSLYGVPGLLEAIRLGRVATANPIGCSVLENPALMAFLPGLCRRLLGEELLLPSVATWWCGQGPEREYVLANLERLLIKPIHPLPDSPVILPGSRNPEQLSQLRERILAAPHLYVAQEPAEFSPIPCFTGKQIEPHHSILSTYLARENGNYVCMPGGLSRQAERRHHLLVSHFRSGCSKDTWVLTPEPDKQVNLWLQLRPDQKLQAQTWTLPSRAAENLFWAGRYAERTEATSRLLRSILIKLRDPDDRRSLNHLLRALTHITMTYPGFVGKGADGKLADPRGELLSLARDSERQGSLRFSLRSLWRAIYAAREQVPEDAWRVVDNMQQNWHPRLSINQIGSGSLANSINQLILQISGFSGLVSENMSRETAWLLLNIGRRLERALNLIELLRATLVISYDTAVDAQIMETVLTTCNSLNVFRRRYRSYMQLGPILELLLHDQNYPRALAYQLQQLQQHIAELPRDPALQRPNLDEKLIDEALKQLLDSNLPLLCELEHPDNNYPQLEALLNTQEDHLKQLSTALAQLYFSPTVIPQQLGAALQESA